MSHDPSEIILIWWFGAQETFLIMISYLNLFFLNKIINIFTLTFEQFNTLLLNKNIDLLKKKKNLSLTFEPYGIGVLIITKWVKNIHKKLNYLVLKSHVIDHSVTLIVWYKKLQNEDMKTWKVQYCGRWVKLLGQKRFRSQYICSGVTTVLFFYIGLDGVIWTVYSMSFTTVFFLTCCVKHVHSLKMISRGIQRGIIIQYLLTGY